MRNFVICIIPQIFRAINSWMTKLQVVLEKVYMNVYRIRVIISMQCRHKCFGTGRIHVCIESRRFSDNWNMACRFNNHLLILWSLLLGFPLYFLRWWSLLLVGELRYVSTMLFKIASLSPFGMMPAEGTCTRARGIWFVLLQQFNVPIGCRKDPTTECHYSNFMILGL